MNPQLRQFVLDAGALIALERADPRIRAVFDEAARQRIELVLPTTVLAQVWRKGDRQARLARAVKSPGVVLAPLDEASARAVGERLHASGTADIVDAHVVEMARLTTGAVFTSGPGDLHKLDETLQLIHC